MARLPEAVRTAGALAAAAGRRLSGLGPARREVPPGGDGDGGVSIVYVTCRPEPCFAWFVESLARQLGPAERVEVVFVDGHRSAGRAARLAALVRGRFSFRHVAPKPCPYSGPHRRTGRDYFTAASARNTGIVHARHGYVAFVDDLSVLGPEWWKEVRRAAKLRYVVAGAYQKRREMAVEGGLLVGGRLEPERLDTRWNAVDDLPLAPIPGGMLYGSSLGAPREALLRVNGFDELCDTARGEDYQLGLRLEWSGEAIYYSRAMLTVESEELHFQGAPLGGIDLVLDPARYMEILAGFGVAQRSTDGPTDISHMVLDVTYGTRSIRSHGNPYSLSDLTVRQLAALPAQFPRRHWFTGQPLGEM